MTGEGDTLQGMEDTDQGTEEVAGELVLCPIVTTARAGEAFTIEWWAREHLAVERVRVWRVPPASAADWYGPAALITGLFRVDGYACAAELNVYGNPPLASELRFAEAVLRPGDRFGVTLRAAGLAEGFALEAPVIVAVSVRRPPPCFRARAAA